MKFLRRFLDAQHKYFAKGGKLEKLYPLYEAADTFLLLLGKLPKELFMFVMELISNVR